MRLYLKYSNHLQGHSFRTNEKPRQVASLLPFPQESYPLRIS